MTPRDLWRVLLGRDALHLYDPAGNARLVLDLRVDWQRWIEERLFRRA